VSITVHIGFLNPQGNFDPADSHLTEHPDFGGQLVYVKQVALALGELGHSVDIITRRIDDPKWPEYATPEDAYPGHPNVRILRFDAGGPQFIRKEELWPHLAGWVANITAGYDGRLPDVMAAHYGDGGLAAVLIEAEHGVPFSFTAHSLGAQKMDKLGVDVGTLADIDEQLHFSARIAAERMSMARSAINVTSTLQERRDQYGHRAYAGAIDPSDDARFAVIPPGVDLGLFDRDAPDRVDVEERIETRLARDLDPDRIGLPAIVASSRLDPKKGHVRLVEAYAGDEALRAASNLVLITGALDDPLRDDVEAGAGERAVLAEIRAIASGAGLEGRISAFALGGQPSLAAGYRYLARRRSVFALTALYEPFGLAPLEAAAAGLPVVVTRNGGPSESLIDDDGEYGILVDPEDPGDVAAGLLRALGPDWDRLTEAGRRRIHERYTWERTAAGYSDVLSRAMAHRSEPGSVDREFHRIPVSLDRLKEWYFGD
jgi:sucrose-phosphate synthase